MAHSKSISANLAATWHAQIRVRQRSLNRHQILYVMEHGQQLWRTGICFYFLREKDIPLSHRHLPQIQSLVGATLLIYSAKTNEENSMEHLIITAYKNPKALRTIKKKVKYRIRRNTDHA